MFNRISIRRHLRGILEVSRSYFPGDKNQVKMFSVASDG